MTEPSSTRVKARDMSRRDRMIGLAVLAALCFGSGLSALGASGADLAHASPVLAGIGLSLIGASLVLLNTLLKS